MDRYAVILAAGKGGRMLSRDPEHSKVSYPILGKALVNYVLDAVKTVEPKKITVVVGFGGNVTKALVEKDAKVVWQKEILGTGHGVLQTKDILSKEKGDTLVIYGDTPLILPETLAKIFHRHEQNKNAITVVTAVLGDPSGYGRIIREEKSNRLLAIREETDCNPNELQITEVNTGICIINNELLFKYIDKLSNNNSRKLFYLSELVEIFNREHLLVDTFVASDMREVFGINNRIQLAYAAKVMRKRINQKLMLEGVSMEDPDSTYISPDVKIGKDTIVMPNTTITGDSVIGENNVIGPNTYLENVKIGHDNQILSSWLTDTKIGNGNEVGPFTMMRANTTLEDGCRVDNFVELKNAHYHNNVKCHRLTYIGNTEIDEKTNIGCGTIIANHDGSNKTRCKIGHDVFIGSGTILEAPITVEDCSFTATGSIITKDVKTDVMKIARARQVDLQGGYTKFKMKTKKK